jgi:hypothetical protein
MNIDASHRSQTTLRHEFSQLDAPDVIALGGYDDEAMGKIVQAV